MANRLKVQGRANVFQLHTEDITLRSYLDWNGKREYLLDTSIVGGVTSSVMNGVAPPLNSFARTTDNTGGNRLFVNDAENIWQEVGGEGGGSVDSESKWKIWRGKLTQSGTNDPTAEEIESTFDNTIYFNRTGVGTYSIISEDEEFVTSPLLTFVMISGTSVGDRRYVKVSDYSDTYIELETSDYSGEPMLADELLDHFIEIRVLRPLTGIGGGDD